MIRLKLCITVERNTTFFLGEIVLARIFKHLDRRLVGEDQIEMEYEHESSRHHHAQANNEYILQLAFVKTHYGLLTRLNDIIAIINYN